MSTSKQTHFQTQVPDWRRNGLRGRLANLRDGRIVSANTRLGRAAMNGLDAALLCVYRSHNSAYVEAFVEPALQAGWAVKLWALDRAAPELSEWTIGIGPGGKFANLNKLSVGLPDSSWVVAADDDIVFGTGDVVALAGLSRIGDLDLAQPSHDAGSFVSHLVTAAHPGLAMRLTGFVEIGPCFVIAPASRSDFMPFPEQGMGWGLDVTWAALGRKGRHLGVIDSVRVRHISPPGETYDLAAEFERREQKLREIGAVDMADLGQADQPWIGSVRGRRPPWDRQDLGVPRLRRP